MSIRSSLERAGLRVSLLVYIVKWSVLSAIIGVSVGLMTVTFDLLTELVSEFFHFSIFKNSFGNFFFLVIPILGGLMIGPLIDPIASEAAGGGSEAIIRSIHKAWSRVRYRAPFVKLLASAITLGSGGSAGKEGPSVQIGGGIGAIIADIFKMSSKDRRIMTVAGVAAGIGSIFKSPLGGAIFAAELPYMRDFETEAIIPAFLSSAIAYSVFSLFMGWQPIFFFPGYSFQNYSELIFFIILGIICGLLGLLYIHLFELIKGIFSKIPLRLAFKPALGAVIVGIFGLFLPLSWGPGYEVIQMIMYGHLAIELLPILAFAKMITSSFTIGSGGSGGVIIPSLYIGAAIGGFLGFLTNNLFPTIVTEPWAFVIAGMGAFFAGVGKMPVSMIVMMSEMTGNYRLLIPLMISCGISYAITGEKTIFEEQKRSKVG